MPTPDPPAIRPRARYLSKYKATPTFVIVNTRPKPAPVYIQNVGGLIELLKRLKEALTCYKSIGYHYQVNVVSERRDEEAYTCCSTKSNAKTMKTGTKYCGHRCSID